MQILIDYNYWARDRLLETVGQLSQEHFTRDHRASLTSAWRDIETQIRAYFAPLDDMNHSTYHRGQVTTMLRQLGATPPKVMDLIAFYRERSTPTA